MNAEHLIARINSASAAILALASYHTREGDREADNGNWKAANAHAKRAAGLGDAAAIVSNITADWEQPEPAENDYLKEAAETLGVILADCQGKADCDDCAGCRE